MPDHFIVNPVATRCPRDIGARIRARFPRSTIRFTERGGDASRLARQALDEGLGRHDRLIACGGDGTFREVAGVAGGRATLGVLPAGTINLVARQLGVPRRLVDALDALDGFTPAPIYPGRCVLDGVRSELFLIGVSAGVDADAVHRVDPGLKRRVGRFAYLAALLARLRRPVVPTLQVTSAGRSFRCGQVVVLKMSEYGGPYRLGCVAGLAAPWLEAVAVERGRGAVLRMFWSALRNRGSAADGTLRWTATRVELTLPAPGRLQIDGDPFTARRAELYPHPAPIRVLRGPPAPSMSPQNTQYMGYA